MTATEPDRHSQLSRRDWIEAGFKLLCADGIDAVQITRLARALEVTRGSFYWHFENRDELLSALLAEWQARNTGLMVSALADAASVEEGILELFAVWVDHQRFDPALDLAIRDWGRRSESVLVKVAAEDDARIGAIAAFFERHDYEPTEAFIRARILYFNQVSYYSLGVSEPMATRMSYLEAYFLCFTGRPLNPDLIATYGRRLRAAVG